MNDYTSLYYGYYDTEDACENCEEPRAECVCPDGCCGLNDPTENENGELEGIRVRYTEPLRTGRQWDYD